MSIAVLEKQIRRFLASQNPEVMSIKGGWGVGKTYAWNRYLCDAKGRKKIALNKYSYVSLFGINSLQDLKLSIYENLIDSSSVGTNPSVKSFKSNTAKLFKTIGNKTLSVLPGSNAINNYQSFLPSLSFLSLENAVICIDDFERKGSEIEAQDILGLITQLKEQKGCKVVLILNDESLSVGSSDDYMKLREKVIDTELRFAPTSEDCVSIALSDDSKLSKLLGENIVRLGVNNIRIIKRAESLAVQLQTVLQGYDGVVLSRAVQTLTLLCWCYYGQQNNAPSYQFVVNYRSVFSRDDNDLILSTQQRCWQSVLRNFDNFTMSNFDLQIAKLVENGYADEEELLLEAAKVNEEILVARSDASFQEAWRTFNYSFDHNEQEVVDCLAASFKFNAKYISPSNLDGTVRLLRYLGKNKMANKIIDMYVEKRSGDEDIFNLEKNELSDEIVDSEVIAKFKEKYRSLRIHRSLQQACLFMVQNIDNCEDEEAQLSQAEVAEYVQLFKSLKGNQLSSVIDMCMNFGRAGGMASPQRTIADNAAEALKVIGAENKLNASRVRRFGVIID